MRITKVMKKLNNTELGKASTHETYILVNKDMDIEGLFPSYDTPISFYCHTNSQEYKIRLTQGRETRIVGLGPFYTDMNADAGDVILLERIELKGKDFYKIDISQNKTSLVFTPSKKGLEILNDDRISLFNDNTVFVDENGAHHKIKVILSKSEKKRSDSPSPTDYYALYIDEKLVEDVGDAFEVIIENNKAKIKPFCAWRIERIDTEV